MTPRTSLRDTLARTAGPSRLVVVSDCHVGAVLAAASDATVDVRLVTDHEGVAGQASDDVSVTVGDLTALDTLRAATDAAAAVVALRSDRRTLLVTQLLRTHLDTDSVIVLLNDPQRRDAIANLSTAVVCGSTCLSAELEREVETTLQELESACG